MNRTQITKAVVLCAGAVFVAIPLIGCNQPVAATAQKTETKKKEAPAKPAPEPEPSKPKAPLRTTTQPARIEPYERTPLFAKIDGYVRKLRTVTDENGKSSEQPIADIGEVVREDDLLAQLWIPEMDAELKQKKAVVTQTQAQLEQAVQMVVVAERAKDSTVSNVGEAEAGVVRAAGEYDRWKSEHERTQTLASRGSLTQTLADERLNQFRASEAAKREAEAKVQSAQAALGEADAKIAEAKASQAAAAAHVEVAEADLLRTKALLGYAKIRAPFPGIVTQRNVDTGHFVQPPQSNSKPLFVVERIDTLRVLIDVPELEAPYVKVGTKAFLKVQALGSEEIEAEITRTAWALEPTTRTLRVEIDLPNPDSRVRPGMYATARIVLSSER